MSLPSVVSDSKDRTDFSILGRQMPKGLKTVLNADVVIAGAAFCALAALTFVGAISRYLMNSPFIWLEELQMGLFLIMVFFGLGAAARVGGHVVIDVFTDLLPEKLQLTVRVFSTLVVAAVLAFFAYEALVQVMNMLQLGRTTSILRIPTALFYSAVPIGFVLMILNSALLLFYSPEEEDSGPPIEDATEGELNPTVAAGQVKEARND